MHTLRWRNLRSRDAAVAGAWLMLPLLVGAYLWLRYETTDPQARLASELIYLIPTILAAAFTVSVAIIGAPGTRARRMWAFLALAASLMFASETYFSLSSMPNSAIALHGGVFDLLNVCGYVALIVSQCVAIGLDRFGAARAGRLILDTAALTTLAGVLLLRMWQWEPMAGVDRMQALRMTAYLLGGLLLGAINLYIVSTSPAVAKRQPWSLYLALAISVYAFAMMLWPWWNAVQTGRIHAPWLEAVTVVAFMAGYHILFIASLSRLLNANRPWARIISRPLSPPSAWPEVAVSTAVLAAVVVLGWAAYTSPEGSTEQLIYFSGLIIATVCMVGRTGLASLESDLIRREMTTDAATSALNPRGFDQRLAREVSLARRFGERRALIIVDLDEFAAVNAMHGRLAGDRALERIATVLRNTFPSASEIFRLSSDEFAVIVRVRSRSEGSAAAHRALEAVRSVKAGSIPLTASAGFALSPDDALDVSTLVRRADIAVAWAKRHGKNRVAGYDFRVSTALGAESPVPGTGADDAGLDIARALLVAADARDPHDFEHSRNVAALSCLLAERIGFDPAHLERLRLAATLHDVGKIAMPPPASREAARQQETSHAVLGASMLRAAHLDDIARWVYHYNEHWDGTGGPDGLSGDAIPIESRIIIIANQYDRLTSRLRDGGPLSRPSALQEIDRGIATRFDPALAEEFIQLVGVTEAMGWVDDWPRP